MDGGSFPWVKRPGRGADHPPPIYHPGREWVGAVPSTSILCLNRRRGVKYGAHCASLCRFGRVFDVILQCVAFLFAVALWEKFASQIRWHSFNKHIWTEKFPKSSARCAAAANLLCSHIDIFREQVVSLEQNLTPVARFIWVMAFII